MTQAVGEELFPDVRFTRVVSLGSDCTAVHALRITGRHCTESVFDWLVTPLDAISCILADDGARLGASCIGSHRGMSVRCGAYGVLYHYEFPREGEGVVFSADMLAVCRAKLLRKMAAFIATCEEAGGPLLFLRAGIETGLPWDRFQDGETAPRAADVDALAATLARRFPSLEFRLLVVEGRSSAHFGQPRDPRVAVVSLPQLAEDGSATSDQAWRSLMSRINTAEGIVAQNKPIEEALFWFGGNGADIARHDSDVLGDLLESALAGARPNDSHGIAVARSALADPRTSYRRRGLAAQVLAGCGLYEEALPILRAAEAEHPDIRVVTAAALEALGRHAEALVELRKAIADAPRDPAPRRLLLRLALLYGDAGEALESLEALVAYGQEQPELAWKTGLDLWHGGRSAQAVRAFEIAYAQGWRHLDFLLDYLGLLTGEARYSGVLDVVDVLRLEGCTSPQVDMLAGHAKLALAQPRGEEIARAEMRANSNAWLDATAVLGKIASAIRERAPFSLIRIGDGEARYVIAVSDTATISVQEARAMGNVVWENWFGEPLAEALPAYRTTLLAEYERAVSDAVVLGVCSPDRLRSDTGHYGYLAWQERWLRNVFANRADVFWTDAHVHRQLNALSPFLAGILEGQDILGVISPHPELSGYLKSRLRIGQVIEYVIPAEGRLPTAKESRTLGRHFPDIYDKLLAKMSVPRPGCVFLVAAGLLGKVYCAKIKALGGIAIDIGAVADAWMGYDTRDGQFAGVVPLRLPAPQSNVAKTTVACVSLGETGSMAIANAVRGAGFPDAVHLQFLGPRITTSKRAEPSAMLDVATEVAGRIDDPTQTFRIVTCVRDPIARILSKAFFGAEQHRTTHGVDIRDYKALIAWWEAGPRHRRDVWSEWFDDSFKTTFGFDYREHPFDHARKSLRFDNDRLRLLVLRQEDPCAAQEAELCWLLDRETVTLRSINAAVEQGYEVAYRLFRDAFVAPKSWLDNYYETDLIRHFYTERERDAFRARWKRPDSVTATDPSLFSTAPRVHEEDLTTAKLPIEDAEPPPVSVAEFEHVSAELTKLRSRLRGDHAVDFNDFAYRPRERDWSNSPGANIITARLDATKDAYGSYLERFCGFDARFREIPVLARAEGPHWENWWLPGLDAVVLYGLVATLAPRTYLEIGSGHSTLFVRQAIRDHGLATRIVSIDPNPTALIDTLSDEVVRTRCADTATSTFARLDAGDMLFFDGSHRSFQNSDATVFFTEILPSLAAGVVYGLHDIFLPFDYPESWTNRFYNEQYLLMAYLLGGASGDEIVFPAHYVSRHPAYAHLRNRLFLGTKHLDWLTSSFWMRRAAQP